jgi:uncharacterized protein (UPF0548 family)
MPCSAGTCTAARDSSSSPVARVGSVVQLSLGWRWLGITVPCRVVYTVEEANRRGFAYGTLPGHQESGEEAFLIEHTPDDNVWLHIRAFSRPARLLPYVGGALARKIQDLVTDRYIAALSGSGARSPYPPMVTRLPSELRWAGDPLVGDR